MRVERHRTLKVFIASPGDVAFERKAAVRVIQWVSDHVAKPLDWRVEPVMWERDVLPGAGRDAQTIINDQIGEMRRVSLFVLLMRGKFGTPTARAKSGTVEEYERALTARKNRPSPKRPEMWLCFGEPKPGSDPKELKKIAEFRAGARRSALYVEFGSTRDFEARFKNDLTRWVNAEIHRLSSPKSAPSERALTPQSAVLLGDRVYRCLRQTEDAGRIALTLALSSSAEETALVALQNGMMPIAYAYRLNGGNARISNVAIERGAKGVRATVELHLPRQGSSSSFGYADENAREGAVRLILLGTGMPLKESVHRFSSGEPSKVVPLLLGRVDDAAGRAEARVRAVHSLLTLGIVTQIERLTLAQPTKDGVKIAFAGRWTSMWGQEFQTLRIEGFVKGKTRTDSTNAPAKSVPIRKARVSRKR